MKVLFLFELRLGHLFDCSLNIFVKLYVFDPLPPYLSLLFAAAGAPLALAGRVAGAHLYRAGKKQQKLIFQHRDSLLAPQTTRVWLLRDYPEAFLLTGPSDRHGGKGWWRGRDLHDSQSAQRRHSGVLLMLLMSDAAGVSVMTSKRSPTFWG